MESLCQSRVYPTQNPHSNRFSFLKNKLFIRKQGKFPILSVRAATGFGKSSKKGEESLTREKELEGWLSVATVDEVTPGVGKAVIVNDNGYVIVKVEKKLYCVDANCTACKFPIVKGKVEPETIECPLCHSKFSLEDGRPIQWCPKDGIFTAVIGTVLERGDRKKLGVYKVQASKTGEIVMEW